jgi:hypothetical protein
MLLPINQQIHQAMRCWVFLHLDNLMLDCYTHQLQVDSTLARLDQL